jgi:aryl-alcohol dehydrogenase-like predicted oxidoreductase
MPTPTPLPRRPLGKTGVELSIVGMGGIVVMQLDQALADRTVAQAIDRGVNYFDVAPTYGDAEDRLGPALQPHRDRAFLACKTVKRDRAGAATEIDGSLQKMRTDRFELYQLHALTTAEDLNQALGPGGAMEAILAAKQAGKIRFIGFSAHSVDTALAAMDRFPFDSILFPFNFVMFTQGNFGPQVLAEANRRGIGVLALKAMARTTWPKTLKNSERSSQKCWYEPCSLPDEAALALRWTLSKPITAAIPPGDERYFPVAMDVAQNFKPITAEEEQSLISRAQGLELILK